MFFLFTAVEVREVRFKCKVAEFDIEKMQKESRISAE